MKYSLERINGHRLTLSDGFDCLKMFANLCTHPGYRLWPDFSFLDFARCILRYQQRAPEQQRLRELCVDSTSVSQGGGSTRSCPADCCSQNKLPESGRYNIGAVIRGGTQRAWTAISTLVSFLCGTLLGVSTRRGTTGAASSSHQSETDPGSRPERIAAFLGKKEAARQEWIAAHCQLRSRD